MIVRKLQLKTLDQSVIIGYYGCKNECSIWRRNNMDEREKALEAALAQIEKQFGNILL